MNNVTSSAETSPQHRENNFDFFRFVLASMVIVSHAPVLLDGNLNREPMYQLTAHHLTLGVIAVNGFFLLSGFLVLQSWHNSRGIWNYMLKRILRIYPGFIIAALFSLLVVGSLGAADIGVYWNKFDGHYLTFICKRILSLRVPPTPETFSGLAYSSVNGAVWTVRYEFVCYAVLALLGLCGVYRKRAVVLVLAFLALCTYVLQQWSVLAFSDHDFPVIGVLNNWPRFSTYFLIGMCFYLFRDKYRFEKITALFSLGMVLIGFLVPHFLWLTIPVFGSYLFFHAGFSNNIPFHNFGRHGDFSYGIFLYGWPVEQLLLWYSGRSMHPVIICIVTLLGAGCLAFLSWHCIEKPFLKLKRSTGTEPARKHKPSHLL